MKKSIFTRTKQYKLIFGCVFLSMCASVSAFVKPSPTPLRNMFHTSTSTSIYATSDEKESKPPTFGTFNPFRLAVLKLGLTELKYTSPLNYEKRSGLYNCANCGSTLFDSKGKYDSGSGWPSYWKTFSEGRVQYKREWDGRIEVSCQRCNSHLGHAFPDGPMRCEVNSDELKNIPSDDLMTSNPDNIYTRLPRYCINGAALKFQEKNLKY